MEKNLFDSLVRSVEEMVAIENGEFQPAPENVHHHVLPDVKLEAPETGFFMRIAHRRRHD